MASARALAAPSHVLWADDAGSASAVARGDRQVEVAEDCWFVQFEGASVARAAVLVRVVVLAVLVVHVVHDRGALAVPPSPGLNATAATRQFPEGL